TSDARYRFERGVDPLSVDWGIHVATLLITELCGGEASEITTAGAVPAARKSVTFRPSRVLALGGVEVAVPQQKQILVDLGFGVTESSADSWVITVPTFRA